MYVCMYVYICSQTKHYSQALIEANAATILSGARPVRARKLPSPDPNRVDIHIAWEDLQPDLTVIGSQSDDNFDFNFCFLLK